MTIHPQIHRVTLRTGLIDQVSDAEGCPSITFLAPDIPEDILQRFEQDDYQSLADSYGDPSWGSPIHTIILRLRLHQESSGSRSLTARFS